jgi:diguanylate cyclase (GGDEF)-like protein
MAVIPARQRVGYNQRQMGKPFALIIEDERDIASLFRHVMDLLGFHTEVVFHGQTAVERLAGSRPDMVLLDLNLPGVSGNQILEIIRKEKRLSHTKVIVITGHAHIVGGLSVQPDLVLLKPVSIEQLTNLISRISLSEQSPKAIPVQQKPLDRPTGLYNQSFFTNRLESSLKQAREIDNYLFAVLLFKLEPGQRTKNQAVYPWESVLQEIAAALRSILRPTDTIARFDPDTFYILIENIPNGEISVQIANRIQQILYRKIADIGDKIKIPIRIGILLCDQGYENFDMVLADAKYAQTLAVAQGDEYSKYYYQVSAKK